MFQTYSIFTSIRWPLIVTGFFVGFVIAIWWQMQQDEQLREQMDDVQPILSLTNRRNNENLS